MKYIFSVLASVCLCVPMSAQHAGTIDCEAHEHADTCIEINEVVVTGLTGTTKMKNSPSPISVVNFSDLRRQSSTNIVDALARQPGMAQITTGGGISKPVIRGLGFNRVVVVNDGIRQEGQQWGEEHGIEIDGENVNSVEILKGPASLRYGSDAMAGVVIFHDAPMLSEDGLLTSLSAGYQTNNGLFDYSLAMQGREGRLFWNARWSQKAAHAYKNRYDGYVYGSQFGEQALTGLLGLHHVAGQSVLRLSAYHTSPGIVSPSPSLPEGEGDAGSRVSYGHPSTYQQIYHYKAVLDNTFYLGSGSLKALLGYQQNRRHEFEDYEGALDLHLHTVNYELHYHQPLGEAWKLVTGVNGMWQQSKNCGEEYLIPDYRLFDIGLFATTSYDAERWHVSGGLRADRRSLTSFALEEDGEMRFEPFRRHFTGVTGSIGTIYNITDRWNIRLNLSRGFRAPNISELGSNGEHEGALRYEVGNHNLKPEYSLQSDLGIDFSSHFISAQLSLFANRIDHYVYIKGDGKEVTGDDGDNVPIFSYAQGDAFLYGGEVNVEMHPVRGLHVDNSFSYVCARQLHQPRASRWLPYTPAPRWNCDVRYELPSPLPWGGAGLFPFLGMGMELNFRQNHFYEVNETETATPSYTLFNMNAGTDLNIHGKRRATLTFNVQNLFDRAYQNHLSRLKYASPSKPPRREGENPVTGRTGIFNMGRNIAINLSIYI